MEWFSQANAFWKGTILKQKTSQKPKTLKTKILLYILQTRFVKLVLFGRFLKYFCFNLDKKVLIM